MQNKLLSLIGLATKAGRCVSGEFAVEKAVKEGNAGLVLIAKDASANTKKHFTDMCSYRNIPIFFVADKESLGKCTGKNVRANIAITDDGFSRKLISVLQEVED